MRFGLLMLILVFSLEARETKIYHGENVGPDELQNVISLTYNGRASCSGTLIDAKTVVTAAHCVTRFKLRIGDLSKYKVYLGNGIVGGKFSGQYDVSSVWIHPLYTVSVGYDLAVVRLSRPVSEAIQFTPLLNERIETQLIEASSDLQVVGFGRTEENTVGVKKKVHIKLREITSNEFVAGGQENKDSCNGDSGGPVFTYVNNQRKFIGVVSRVLSVSLERCGEGGVYGKASIAKEIISIAEKFERVKDLLEIEEYHKALALIDEALEQHPWDSDLFLTKNDLLEKLNLVDDSWLMKYKINRVFNELALGSAYSPNIPYMNEEVKKIENSTLIYTYTKLIIKNLYKNRKINNIKEYDTSVLHEMVNMPDFSFYDLDNLFRIEFEKENYEQAALLLARIRSLQPTNRDYLSLEVKLSYDMGNLEEAFNLALRAIEVNGFDHFSYFVTASKKHDQNEILEAYELINKSLAIYPFSSRANSLKASLQKKLALDDDAAITEINAKRFRAWELTILAKELQEREEYDQAFIHITEAIALNPSLVRAYTVNGELLLTKSRKAEAEASFLKAYEMKPSNDNTIQLIRFYLYEAGLNETALEYANDLILRSPSFEYGLRIRAQIYVRQEKFDIAIEDVKRAIEFTPKSSNSYSSLSFIYFQINDFENALEAINQSLLFEPNDSYYHSQRSDILVKLERKDEALLDIEQAIAYAPEDIYYITKKAEILGSLEQFDEAIMILTDALAQEPSNPSLYYSRYLIYKKMGKEELASQDYQRYQDIIGIP